MKPQDFTRLRSERSEESNLIASPLARNDNSCVNLVVKRFFWALVSLWFKSPVTYSD